MIPNYEIPSYSRSLARSQVPALGDCAGPQCERWKLVFQFTNRHWLRDERVCRRAGKKLPLRVDEIVWMHGIGLLLPVRVSRRGSGSPAFAVYVVKAPIALRRWIRPERRLAVLPACSFAPTRSETLRKRSAIGQKSACHQAPLAFMRRRAVRQGFLLNLRMIRTTSESWLFSKIRGHAAEPAVNRFSHLKMGHPARWPICVSGA